MKKQLTLTAALMLTTTAASAAGIDRTLTNYGIMFETGNYAELSYATVSPDVSGEYPAAAPFGGGSTGNMSEDFSTLSGSVKYDLSDRLAVGLFSNQPFGADASYNEGFYTGLAAEWNSRGTSVVLKYQINPNISVYGGIRSIVSQATVRIPNQLAGANTAQQLIAGAQQAAAGAQQAAAGAAAAQAAAQAAAAGGDLAGAATLAAQATALAAQAQTLATQAQTAGAQAQAILDPANATTGPFTYTATTDSDRQTSYILGAAYERKEIALRVALTYESGYDHEFNSTENLAAAGLADFQSVTNVSMPDVYTLDFQSGVAPGTLVFGSIRHATWSDWEVRPDGYEGVTGTSVVGIENDSTTYRIGVGRQITDQFSGFARITYEPSNGDTVNRLAPTDGSTAFGFGGSYSNGPIKITGGVEYIRFGEGTDPSGVAFAENDAVAVGLSVGYRF